MTKVKNTIPVYDICSLGDVNHLLEEIVAEPFGAYLRGHPNLHFPHRHTFYHIVLFTEGQGYHTIDFEQFPVKAGQIYFMIPGQVHSWSFEGNVDGFVINFSEDLFRNFLSGNQYLEQFAFLRGIANESVIQVPGNKFSEIVATVTKIADEVRLKRPFGIDMARAYLLTLLIEVSRGNTMGVTTNAPQQNQLVLYNFRKLVDQYFAEKRLPKEYAAMLYVTPNHLNALCNDLPGKPAGEVIRDRILLEAKRLLINADLGIQEIAYRLNFSDNAHLTKFFKKNTNLTPEEFRKSSLIKH